MGDEIDKTELPEPSATCKHFESFLAEKGTVTLAVDIPGKLYQSSGDGVTAIAVDTIQCVERSTSDATELGLWYEDGEDIVECMYSFAEPQLRQQFYQALLCCNPFELEGSKPSVKDVEVYMAIVDTGSPVPPGIDDSGITKDLDVYVFMLKGEFDKRQEWTAKLSEWFEDYECHPELTASSEDLGHDLVCFTSEGLGNLLSNCQSSTEMGAETAASAAITFWIGETSYGIYASDAEEYEDCYIGSWQLDLHQFRHFLAMGSTVTKTLPLSGGELAKNTCGTEGNFIWRSSADLAEGNAFQKSSGSLDIGTFAVMKAPAMVPAMQRTELSKPNYVLILDNLRASNVSCENGEAAYVYVGSQFCEDRRTSSKTGTATPVWMFERQVGGQSQNSIEVLQLPTYSSDADYLKAQRLMIAVMDDTKGEDDPMIGYAFLPLKKYISEPDTAHEFVLDLTFFMQTTCSLTGRISAHLMESEVKAQAAVVKSGNGASNAKIISQYFRRYDLDESGTINSHEELQQLCTNLSVRLELPWAVSDIDAKVTSAGDMEANSWSQEEFSEWFGQEFQVELS